MRKLIMILMLVSCANAFAEDKIVQIRNGKTSEYDPKDWVVVHRRPKKVVVKPKVEAPLASRTVEVTKEVLVVQKNHLRLLGGVGPTGVGLEQRAGYAALTRNNMAVFGLAYGRNLSERWSLEGAALTNGTALIGAGYNW